MPNGSWDKRQWEALQGVTYLAPDGSPSFKMTATSDLLGVGPHDYVAYTYSGDQISEINYYTGGSQAGGQLVATVIYSYNASSNVTSIERTFP